MKLLKNIISLFKFWFLFYLVGGGLIESHRLLYFAISDVCFIIAFVLSIIYEGKMENESQAG